MASGPKIHVVYIILAIAMAFGGFFFGRHTVQRIDSETLKEVTSDPKMAEAAQAVNALKSWGDSMKDNVAKAAAEEKNKRDLDERERNAATDSLQTPDVLIKAVKTYRGKLKARSVSLRNDPEFLDHDCLAVAYVVENVSKTAMVTESVRDAFDNFGNKLEQETEADYSDVIRLVGAGKVEDGQIAPGELRLGYVVLKRPLPNASWLVIDMSISKANGENVRAGYIKTAANMNADTVTLERIITADKEAEAAKVKAETDAKNAKFEAKVAAASDTLTTSDVRIHFEKIYRGPLNRAESDGDTKSKLLDCLLVGYTVQNLSTDTVLDAFSFDAFDDFGNKLEREDKADHREIWERLGIADYKTGRLAPGEAAMRYSVFKRPLPNATWFMLKMLVVVKSDRLVEPGYLKASLPQNPLSRKRG